MALKVYNMNVWKYHPYIIIFLVGAILGWVCRPEHIREVTKKITDTLVVVDTHVVEKPVLVEKTIKDSMLVAIHDTTIVNDTIFVALPIESKTYKGEDYLAVISGYRPNLDRIEVYPKTTTVTKTETITYHPQNRLSIGAEATYIHYPYTPIYLEYERMLHKNVGVFGKVLFDVPTRTIGVGAGVELTVGW